MPIIVIGNDGETQPKKTQNKAVLPREVITGQKSVKVQKPVPAAVIEDERHLISLQKKNPYDIGINLRLAAFYRRNNNWPEAEHHEEIVEWLDRIRRFVSSR